MKKWMPAIAVVVVTIVISTGLMVFLEVALRLKNRVASSGGPAYQRGGEAFFAPIFDPNPYMVVYNMANFSHKGIHTNSVGFRGTKEYSRKKEPGVRRIFVTGGSAAVGFNASSDEHTIASNLERMLNEGGGTKYEVINAACAGFNSHQDLILMGIEVMHWDPDLIVSLSGGTDINTSMSPKWRRNYHELLGEQDKLITHPWHRHSQAIQFLGRMIPTRPAPAGPGVFHEEAASTYVQNVLSMAGMASASGVHYLSVLQPAVAVSTKKITPKESELYEKALKRGGLLLNYSELVKKLYEAARAELKEADMPKGTAVMDGSDLFAGADFDAFSDAFHLTDEGYRFAAAAIRKELDRLGFLGGKSPRTVASP